MKRVLKLAVLTIMVMQIIGAMDKDRASCKRWMRSQKDVKKKFGKDPHHNERASVSAALKTIKEDYLKLTSGQATGSEESQRSELAGVLLVQGLATVEAYKELVHIEDKMCPRWCMRKLSWTVPNERKKLEEQLALRVRWHELRNMLPIVEEDEYSTSSSGSSCSVSDE